ncbi:MAG: hypothetical protein ACRDBR_02745 [Metamycoplasmataceae bacterium]
MPYIIIFSVLGVILLLIIICFFCTKFIISKQNKYFLNLKKEFSDTKLIKYKNEIGSISSFNLEQSETIEIESLWFNIEKLTKKNKKNIEIALQLLSEYKLIQSYKIFKKIQEINLKLKTFTFKFDSLAKNILGNVKGIQSNIAKLKKGIREIKNYISNTENKFSERTIEKIINEITYISSLIKKIESLVKNVEEDKYKQLFVELSWRYKELILFMNNIKKIDNFLFNIYSQEIAEINKLAKNVEDETKTNLALLDIETKKQEINVKWKEAIELLYKQNFSVDNVIELIREINKSLSNLKHSINFEKKSYIFIQNNRKIIFQIEEEIKRTHMQIMVATKKAIEIDSKWFDSDKKEYEAIDKLVEEIAFFKDNIEMEEKSEIYLYSKLFYLYKNFLNKINILKEKLNEVKTKLRIFYYEENSTRLKIELLHKMFFEINFSLQNLNIAQTEIDKIKHQKINNILEIIQEKTYLNNNSDLDDDYSILYKEFIYYFKENLIKIYKAILFQKLIFEIGYLRSSNPTYHKEILKAELYYENANYDSAIKHLLKYTKIDEK